MKKTLGLTAMLLAFVAMATTASATTACTSGTVAVVGGGASTFDCTIGGLEFNNFVALNGSNSNNLTIDLVSATVDNGTVTLLFNPNMTMTGAQDILLFFTVTGGINQLDLQNGGTTGTSIEERACSAGTSVSGACIGGDANQLGNTIVSGGGSANVFSTPFTLTSPVSIFKDIRKAAGNGTDAGGPLQHLSSFSQSFHTAVPEPMTLSMMGIGLLGLGLARRRQQGKK